MRKNKRTTFLTVAVLALLGVVVVWFAARGGPAPPRDPLLEMLREMRVAVETLRDFPTFARQLETSRSPVRVALRRKLDAAPERLAQERAAAEEAGLSLDPDQLTPPRPGANAAPFYLQLTALLDREPLDVETYATLGSLAWAPPTDEEAARLRAALDARPDILAFAEQAARRPRCAFHEDLGLRPLSTCQVAGQLLSADGLLLAREGRLRRAITRQAQALNVARHLDDLEIPYGGPLGTGTEEAALRGLAEALRLAGPDSRMARAVQAPLVEHEPPPIRQLIRAKTAFTIRHLTDLRGAGPLVTADAMLGGLEQAVALIEAFPGEWPSNEVVGQVQQQWDAERRAAIAAAARPLSPEEERRWQQLLDLVEADLLAEARRLLTAADAPFPQRQLLFPDPLDTLRGGELPDYLRALLPTVDLPELDRSLTRRRAWRQLLFAAGEVLVHHSRTGAFPETLAEALQPPPADPFTGEPFGYRREGDGFVIYSAGESGEYDGGRPGTRPPPQVPVFRYPEW